jgi:23S rRNA (cytidine1920-2'-O)/16S rRNA (cytidine1409-2'-O)-methyltransferase
MKRKRLDLIVVERGLAPSRARAQALILARRIRVDGSTAVKAGTQVGPAAEIELIEPDIP